MKNFFLGLSGVIFTIITILHFLRFIFKWPVVIGPVTIDSSVSLWAGLISLVLAGGCFLAQRKP